MKIRPYISVKALLEHIGDISLSTLDKLMTEGLPYLKIGGSRRVGFCKMLVNRWLKEKS